METCAEALQNALALAELEAKNPGLIASLREYDMKLKRLEEVERTLSEKRYKQKTAVAKWWSELPADVKEQRRKEYNRTYYERKKAKLAGTASAKVV